MSNTPFENAESLHIGTVDFVSPSEIKVALDIEAPESVAMNSGGPRPFPRVNNYLLIPADNGYLVGQVEWITVERSAFPKRKGMQDFGLIDLPYPLRKLSLNPLGILKKEHGKEEKYTFRRGADTLPSIGANVLLPTDVQLRNIIESGENRWVKIGVSPLAGNAEVAIDPDRLFGRHLAVLGNTGSGKSCSVAGLIRWSLEAAAAQSTGVPNARFIVLDPNGEYSRAFSDDKGQLKARIFKVSPDSGELPLQVPIWFWNSAEWCSFTQASGKTQRPTLMQALRAVRDGTDAPAASKSHEMRRFLRGILGATRLDKNIGAPWAKGGKNFFEKIKRWKETIDFDMPQFDGVEASELATVSKTIAEICDSKKNQQWPEAFTKQEVDKLIASISSAHAKFGGSEADVEPLDVDSPKEFKGDSLLRSVEATAETLNVSEYVETLLIRIKGLLADTRMKPIVCDTEGVTLEKWLEDYVGGDKAKNGCISILDLSLVPSEVVHILTAVVARIVFEALQRYRRLEKTSLPTVLVMEEAHTFIKRYRDDIEGYDASAICCQVFERIAREGRKFGLGLVLSSQRPSELSPTVLSQCNSFLLHRISNDRDQELVHKLVPDNLKGLLRELPTLPSQNAVLLGWASELPVLVKMNDLPRGQQPRSEDPDFWNVWVCKDRNGNCVERPTKWKEVAADWQGNRGPTSPANNNVGQSSVQSHTEEDIFGDRM